MKTLLSVSLLFFVTIVSAQNSSAKDKSSVNKAQHIAVENFPKNMVINHLNGWGGMTIAINELPAGTDLSPLLEGLKNNSCQVPHWGYILKGSMRLKYDDGKEVILKAGDVFYMAPGHKGVVEEDLKLIDFSPEKEMKELISHIEKKIAGAKQ